MILLESKQTELLELASESDFVNWLSSPVTKAMFIQLEIDVENLKNNWADNAYIDEEESKAKGQAMYIKGLYELLREFKRYD